MIKFKKLKVKGFKSFVEPTEILIENGLTGIVGPVSYTHLTLPTILLV